MIVEPNPCIIQKYIVSKKIGNSGVNATMPQKNVHENMKKLPSKVQKTFFSAANRPKASTNINFYNDFAK